jgi:release factor glutamine methyltransferase
MAMNMLREAGRLHRDIAARLKQRGNDTAMLDARLILSHVTGLDDVALISNPDAEVSEAQAQIIEQLILRRLAGEPVSRLLGYKEFYGRAFKVTSATLDPRPDTEVLVEAALRVLAGKDNPQILDLGTGTGAIIISLLAELEGARGIASDISGAALDVCRTNAVRHGVNERLHLANSNWLDQIEGEFDLIVSNPPYIPASDIPGLEVEVCEHDPRLALDGGEDGLQAYRNIVRNASPHLTHKGCLLVEFGVNQNKDVVQLALDQGWICLDALNGQFRDLSGIIRCAGFRPG